MTIIRGAFTRTHKITFDMKQAHIHSFVASQQTLKPTLPKRKVMVRPVTQPNRWGKKRPQTVLIKVRY